MMKKLNILDLHRSIHEKKERNAQCYDKVLEMAHNKIKKTTESKQLRCVYDVPSFIFGYPLFDINECIAHVTRELQSNGFVVRYMFPNKLYISWDLEEIEEEKKTMLNAKTSQIIPLQRQQPVAAPNAAQRRSLMKYKPSGKLELNLI